MNDITPKLKDDVLNTLCSQIPAERALYSLNASELVKQVNSDIESVFAVLKQFERKGLISDLNAHPAALRLILMTEAVDLKNAGGFQAQEALIKANIDKLFLELEKHKPELLQKGSAIASILSGIQSGLELWNKFSA